MYTRKNAVAGCRMGFNAAQRPFQLAEYPESVPRSCADWSSCTASRNLTPWL